MNCGTQPAHIRLQRREASRRSPSPHLRPRSLRSDRGRPPEEGDRPRTIQTRQRDPSGVL